MKYDAKEGNFYLGFQCHAKVSCAMDYALYPFDTQKCKFAIRSATKDTTSLVSQEPALDPTNSLVHTLPLILLTSRNSFQM